MEQQHRALDGGELVEQHEEGEGERVGQLGCDLGLGLGGVVDHQRLRQVGPDVGLLPVVRRAQPVDGEAGDGAHEERLRVVDLRAVDGLPAQPRVLAGVLGVADAAGHPVGDAEQPRPQGLECLGAGVGRVHAATIAGVVAAARPAARPLANAASASIPSGPTQSPAT